MNRFRVLSGALVLMLVVPAACGSSKRAEEAAQPVSWVRETGAMPAMRWDHRPEADIWTANALSAMERDGRALTALVPRDIDAWCPAYRDNSERERALFWVGLLSALAKHESTWNPRASGGGGRWLGLTQIAPRTARAYDCRIKGRKDLFDGSKNLSCAIRIMRVQVPKGRVVSTSRRKWKGMAADWAPFRVASKRADMARWTARQSYCRR